MGTYIHPVIAGFLEFWFNSIHTYRCTKNGRLPRMILVATHRDKLPQVRHVIGNIA
jgi:hypothetical protein